MEAKKITKIGILVTLTVIVFIWGLNFLKGKNILKKENEYYAVYNRIDGLSTSSAVYVNGFKIGQVNNIQFNQNGSKTSFVISFIIGENYQIPQNTSAQIYSADIMGTKAVRFIYKDTTAFHTFGDTIIGSIEGDLKEQVNMQILPLKRKAENLIASLDSAITVLRLIFNKSTRDNLKKSFASIKTTIFNLERTTFTLDTILVSQKSKLAAIFSHVESITSNLKDNNNKITGIINNFSNISDSLAKVDIVKTLNNADKAMLDLSQIVQKVNNGKGSISLLLNNDTLYNNLENASYNLNRLVRDLRENPKRYINFSVFDLGKTVYVLDPDERSRRKEMKKQKRKAKREERKNKNKDK